MHNHQRLLFSTTRKDRENNMCFSGNKENNIKMFNHQGGVDDIRVSNNLPSLRYDYDGRKRLAGRYNIKNNNNLKSELLSSNNLQSVTLGSELMSNEYDLGKSNSKDGNAITPSHSTSRTSQHQQLQIQAYTNRLLQNNTSYQQQIVELKQQLAILRSQHQLTIAESIKYRVNIEKKQQQQSCQYNEEIQKLVKQLKQILSAKELMQQQYNEYIHELIEEHNVQLLNKTQQLAKAQQFFRQKLSNYKSTLSINNQQTQKLYFEASESKIKLIKQIDQLNYHLDKEKAAKRQLHRDNQQLIKIVKQLQGEEKQIKQKLAVKEMEVFTVEKQKNQIIIQLKLQNKQLTELNTKIQAQLKQLNNLLTAKSIDQNEREKQFSINSKQLEELTKKLIDVTYQLQECKVQKVKSEQMMTRKTDSFNKQLNEYEKIVEQLQSSVKQLTEDITNKQSQLENNRKQLESATTQIQTLHVLQTKLTKDIQQLEEFNRKYKTDNINLLEQLEILTLQNKSLRQDKVNKDNQLNMLEQMCERLQNRLKSTDKKDEIQCYEEKGINHNKLIEENDYMRREVNKLIEENHSMRREIQLICQQYEKKLQQKELKWQNRVEIVEKQIQSLMRIKNISNVQLKNQPIIQPQQRSYQRNKQLKSPMIIKNIGTLNNQEQYHKNNTIIKQNSYNDNLIIQKQKPKYYQQAQMRLAEFRNSRRQSYC